MSVANNTPVQFLPGIGWRTAKVLHELDIHTAGQLNSMPMKVLVELFGPSIKSVIVTLHGGIMHQPTRFKTKAVKVAPAETFGFKAESKRSFLKRLQLAVQYVNHV